MKFFIFLHSLTTLLGDAVRGPMQNLLREALKMFNYADTKKFSIVFALSVASRKHARISSFQLTTST